MTNGNIAPTYKSLTRMAKDGLGRDGIHQPSPRTVYTASAEQAGASFGVAGAIGSAVTNFALNELSKNTADKKHQKYVDEVAGRTEFLTQHLNTMSAIVQPIALKYHSNPDGFVKNINLAKGKYFSTVPTDQQSKMTGLWGSVAYPHFGKIQKNAVLAQKNKQHQVLLTANTVAGNSLMASAGVGDTNAMAEQLKTYQSTNSALVVSGFKTADDAVKNELDLMGAITVARLVADGDFAGASTRIDVLRTNPEQAHLALSAQGYLDDQLANLDKRNRHNNNLADSFADKQTDSYRKHLGENANKQGWSYAIGKQNLYAKQATMNPDVFSASVIALEKFNPVVIMQEPLVATAFKSVKARLLDASNNMLNMGGGDAIAGEVARRLFVSRVGGVSIANRSDTMFVNALGDKVLAQVSVLGDLSSVKDLSFDGIAGVMTDKQNNFITQSQSFWNNNGQAGLKAGWAKQEQGKWIVIDNSKMPSTVGNAWQNITTGKESIITAVKSLTALQKLLYPNPLQAQEIGDKNAK